MVRAARLPELLAPAGDFDALVAAVHGGADAVYIGGKSFSARAFAHNFDIDGVRRAVRYCHIHNVRLYVALNTLIFDRELGSAVEYAAELYRAGVDALICADIGLIRELKRVIPDFEIHASTQMSVHNSLGADEAARLGITRVVLARELSLDNIRATVRACAPECEIFLHGALCVCHSGQCLFSSLVGGRSGNRGECAQPCRLPYNGKYPLSLRDLSLAEHIPELIESGVASLKIEGRMKSPDYVYRVTAIYRRLLDEGRRASGAEREELAKIFSRGGFTDGYLLGKTDKNMTGVRSQSDKDSTRALDALVIKPNQAAARAKIKIKAGEPIALTVTLGDRCAEVLGEIPSPAISAPLNARDVKARLCKTGGTSISLAEDDIICELDEGLNAPPSALNAVRRQAIERLESCERDFALPEGYKPRQVKSVSEGKLRTAQFFDAKVYCELIKRGAGGFLDIAFLPLFSELEAVIKGSHGVGVYMPPVITEGEIPAVKQRLTEVKKLGVLYTLVGNIGHFSLAREAGLVPIGDFRLNITNSFSAEYWRGHGASRLVLSPEITLPMARDIGGGEIVYGRIPLMLTERCFIKENFGCDRCGKAALTDRQGAKFPIIREWGHRNIILNSQPTYMADRQGELDRHGICHTHFIFSTETPSELQQVVSAFKRGTPPAEVSKIRRIGSLTSKAKKEQPLKNEK